MPKAVIVIVANPHGADKVGEVAEGFYTRDGDVLTMTDKDGIALRDENTGERITVRLSPSDDEKSVAKRTTLRLYRAANGDEMSGFHTKRLDYPSRGWA